MEMDEVMTSLLNSLLGNQWDTGKLVNWEKTNGEAQRLAEVWEGYKRVQERCKGRTHTGRTAAGVSYWRVGDDTRGWAMTLEGWVGDTRGVGWVSNVLTD